MSRFAPPRSLFSPQHLHCRCHPQPRLRWALETRYSLRDTSTTVATRRSWLICWLTSCLAKAARRSATTTATATSAARSSTQGAGLRLRVSQVSWTGATHTTSAPTWPYGSGLLEAEALLARLQGGRRAGGEEGD